MIQIKVWVTPRYLDGSWFSSFTCTRDKPKNGDIRAILTYDNQAYKDAQNTSYEQLEANCKELESVAEQWMNDYQKLKDKYEPEQLQEQGCE
jgi:hypothetical protein